jgi:transcriptional regulator with GAF, ATPase, and Fis domain
MGKTTDITDDLIKHAQAAVDKHASPEMKRHEASVVEDLAMANTPEALGAAEKLLKDPVQNKNAIDEIRYEIKRALTLSKSAGLSTDEITAHSIANHAADATNLHRSPQERNSEASVTAELVKAASPTAVSQAMELLATDQNITQEYRNSDADASIKLIQDDIQKIGATLKDTLNNPQHADESALPSSKGSAPAAAKGPAQPVKGH